MGSESTNDARTLESTELTTTSSLSLSTNHPAPVDHLEMSNGHVVEIFDLNGVLVTELGEAGTAPLGQVDRVLISQNRLVDLALSIRPDRPVPAALYALQARITINAGGPIAPTTLQDAADPNSVSGSLPVESTKSGVQPDTLVGCSNGCCDPVWTAQTLCNFNLIFGNDYTWYLFNVGSSWENSSSAHVWTGTVCAATGASTYSVSVNNGQNGGVWTVPQGFYMNFNWGASCNGWPFCNGASVTSSVNSPSNPHTQMYCGAESN